MKCTTYRNLLANTDENSATASRQSRHLTTRLRAISVGTTYADRTLPERLEPDRISLVVILVTTKKSW